MPEFTPTQAQRMPTNKRKAGKKWLKRSEYGQYLYDKFRALNQLFLERINVPEPDIDRIIALSRAIDYNVQLQLSNIHAVEEFETLEKLERWKNEFLEGRGKVANKTNQIRT